MSSRFRNLSAVVVLLLLALIALLLFWRCAASAPLAPAKVTESAEKPIVATAVTASPGPKPPDEALTPATLQAPARVEAGAVFHVQWAGPDNPGDYVAIVRPGDASSSLANYAETRKGATLELLAPADSGEWEVRYITARSKTILARSPLAVDPASAVLGAAPEVIAGAKFPVTWQGPKNPGDYLTIVPKGARDGEHRNYADIAKGSPVELLAPIDSGEAEIRYMTGSHLRVLARREIRVVAAAVTLDAPDEVVAGASISVAWTGPKNGGDYLTIVPQTAADGEHGNYADVSRGSPLKLASPMRIGPAEIRYMSGQGAKVLARRAINVIAAEVTLTSPAKATAGEIVSIEWRGPNNPGDYLTIVPRTWKDGTAFNTTPASRGSPAKVGAPKESGPCEIRYMSGQDHLVLARTAIEVR